MEDPKSFLRSKKLVINGGDSPLLPALPPEESGIPRGAADDVAAVVHSGRTNYWGGGPRAKEFEAAMAQHLGRKFAFFHNSGSSALITALYAVGASEGTTVAIGSSGFVAAINAIYHNHARPYFLPTDPATLQTVARPVVADDAPQFRAALLTHFLGNVAPVQDIVDEVQADFLIEDAGQAHGARLNGRLAGSIGDIGSLAGSHKKLVTCGQGGINVTDSPEALARMRTLGHHGKANRQWGEVPGFNFRGGEMEAVLGLHSLRELSERVAARCETADAITAVLEADGLQVACTIGPEAEPAWFDVAWIIPEEWRPMRDQLVTALKAENVPAATYPSLIEMPWVQPWMEANGWWDDYHRQLEVQERNLWGRVIVLASQLSVEDGHASAEAIVRTIHGK